MALELKPPYLPMEAESVDEIPVGDEWQYEPKWDGFRCLAFRDGDNIELQSKSRQPLSRYFPELIAGLMRLGAKRFVLDGEIVVPDGTALSFDQLLQRIHPAASRIQKLAAETPALLILFDLLADTRGRALVRRPLRERRQLLDAFAKKFLSPDGIVRLSPAATDLKQANRWFRAAGRSLDGIIAKRLDLPYQSGERTGMKKIKQIHTVDCVVGGFRYASKGKVVGSLLLGLYDEEGLLHHVGYTSSLKASERERLTAKLEALIELPDFTGRAPGGPSRWSTKRSSEWQPLAPRLVIEIEYDHFTGGRFRHGTKFIRWRPDKAPRQCKLDQVGRRGGGLLKLLQGNKRPTAQTSA